jgi:hypothetical protein
MKSNCVANQTNLQVKDDLICLTHRFFIQGVFEMRAQILTTSYWLHVELEKISKKLNDIYFLSFNFF